MNQNGVSIIICCYNSARRIRKTLEHIYAQNLEGIDCELLVIDNNCTDDTVAIVNSFQNQAYSPFPLRIIKQPIPGLSFTREKGIENAIYEYLIFCDDDNWLSPDYVATSFQIMKDHSFIGALGGRSEAVSDIEFPYWFSTFQGNYAVGVLGIKSGEVTLRGEVWGAGMVFRKSDYQALKNAGFTHLLTDRKENALSGGGDTELCKWFLLLGKKLWYDDRLSFKHYIEPPRLTLEYFEKLSRGNEQCLPIIRKYDIVLHALNNSRVAKLKNFFRYLIHSGLNVIRGYSQQNNNAYLEASNPFSWLCFDEDVKKINTWVKRLPKSSI